jgi:hypothetical protein
MSTSNGAEKKDSAEENTRSTKNLILWLVTLLRFVDALLIAVGFEGIAEFIGHLLALWLG